MPRIHEPKIAAYVGKRIRALRQEHGLSQAELGEALGVSHQHIAKMEIALGRVSVDALWLIAKKLGSPITAFFPAA